MCTFPASTLPFITMATAWIRFTTTVLPGMHQIQAAWYCVALHKLATFIRSIRKLNWEHRKRILYRHAVSSHISLCSLQFKTNYKIIYLPFRFRFLSLTTSSYICLYACFRIKLRSLPARAWKTSSPRTSRHQQRYLNAPAVSTLRKLLWPWLRFFLVGTLCLLKGIPC